MTCAHILSLSSQTPIWNRVQRERVPDAIKYLVEKNYITGKERGYIRLSQKGYDSIHMMSRSEIISSLLRKYQEGDTSTIDPSEYGIDRTGLLEIIEAMERSDLITGAAITRAGQGNRIVTGWPEKARITNAGIHYLENDGRVGSSNQITYNISNSSIVGSQIGTSNSQLNFNQDAFSGEISQAINEIKDIADVSKEHEEAIIDLLKQADTAVQNNDIEAQKKAKDTWQWIKRMLGKTAPQIISVLSGLANIAQFFGLPQ